MPVQVSYPGVYVQEVPSGVRTITGVSTSVAAFVGMTRRGRLGVPTRVRSYLQFVRLYAEDNAISETSTQVQQFFQNGGQEAWITRIADNTARQAEISLENEDGTVVLDFTALDAGTDGDLIRLEVDYDTADPEHSFNLRVFRLEPDGFGGLQVAADETFNDVDMNDNSGRFVRTVVNQQSTLVSVAVAATAPAPGDGFSLSGVLVDTDNTTAVGTLNGEISVTSNAIQISVDGGPFYPVVLPALAAADAPALTTWQTAINNLNPTGASITANLVAGPSGARYVEFRSAPAAGGGSVRILPGVANDLAGRLQLGTDQGGLEVSGFAERRPAPNGHFARLGGLALTNFSSFVSAPDIGAWTLTDASGGPAHSDTPTLGSPMHQGTASTGLGVGSLLNVRQNLQLLADSLNDHTNNQWQARLDGVRLVLGPQFGGVNSDPTAALSSAGTLDLSDPNELFDLGSADTSQNVASYSLGTTGIGLYQTGGTGGVNGGVPATQDYRDAFAMIDSDVDLFNLLILPRANGQTDAMREAVWGPASTFCQESRAFLLVDPRATWADADDVDSEIGLLRIGVVTDHAAIYWPRVTVADNGTTRTIDPSGSIAGLMARIDSSRGVWKAPAGIEAGLRSVRGVERTMTDLENGTINNQAVNAIRLFPSGVVSWGARTMAGHQGGDYRYVPVRRIALFIEESLYRGLRFAVFEPNDEPLWAQIRLAAGAFMNNLFRQGAFQGQMASDAYFVHCDAETTTQNDINLGIVNVVVGFAPLRPAEFIVITIQQKAGQVQV